MGAIETAVDEYFDRVAPDGIKADASLARCDLYGGPLYFDSETGEECLWCDPNRVPFDFSAATDRLSEWFGEFSTLYFVAWVPEVCAMPDHQDDTDAQEIDPDYLKQLMFGRELASYV